MAHLLLFRKHVSLALKCLSGSAERMSESSLWCWQLSHTVNSCQACSFLKNALNGAEELLTGS